VGVVRENIGRWACERGWVGHMHGELGTMAVLGLACLLVWRSMVELGPVGTRGMLAGVLLFAQFSNFLVTQFTWQSVIKPLVNICLF
jgi:hypothetical protein